MKLKHVAIITTIMVIIAGIALISPLYLRHAEFEPVPRVMLGFSVNQDKGVMDWCKDLSAILESHRIGASLFFTGSLAEQYPQCLTYFSDKVDIGSETYNNSDLTSITDYALKLQAVQQGKSAVDKAGNLYSQIFRAPGNAVNQDIYSLLRRSDIRADFSYAAQYNLYQNNQFVKYEARVYEGGAIPADINEKLSQSILPSLVFFDNTTPVNDIEAFLSGLKTEELDFVNASELAGLTLTSRGN